MNDNQRRALWATALIDLAEAISHHGAPLPTSIDIWTQQGITGKDLLNIADGSTPEPLPIKIHGRHYAAVIVPTGAKLELPMDWHFHTDSDLTDDAREAMAVHNKYCMDRSAPDADEADPTAEPEGKRCPDCGESMRLIGLGYVGHIPGEACAPAENKAEHLVRCASSEPHDPHPTTFHPATGINNGQCPGVPARETSTAG